MSDHRKPGLATPLVPISWGELLDKISILEIKVERIKDLNQRSFANHELAALAAQVPDTVAADSVIIDLRTRLKAVNLNLWDIEDELRAFEALQQFGESFVARARAVYQQNDARAELKRAINAYLGSELREVKQHPPYADLGRGGVTAG